MSTFACRGAAGIAALVWVSAAFAQVRYSVQEIPAPSTDTQSFATAMNARGQVTGYPAFFFDGTQTRDLAKLGGTTAYGQALNVAGDVTGSSNVPLPRLDQYPVVWIGGAVLQIALPTGSWGGGAFISDAGVVVGNVFDSNYVLSTFRWSSGTTEISPLGYELAAANNAGVVVGNRRENGQSRAYVWTTSAFTPLTTPLAGSQIRASSINDDGTIVGFEYTAAVSRPVRWTPAGNATYLPDLGVREARAFRINDAGYVLGDARAPTMEMHSVLWNATGALQDLGTALASDVNASGVVIGAVAPNAAVWDGSWRLLVDAIDPADPFKGALLLNEALAINDAGQILASGYDLRVEDRLHKSFVLTPIAWPFSGFLRPLLNPPTLNRVHAGASVRVRFGLGGPRGLSIFAPGYPRVVTTSCTTGVDSATAPARLTAPLHFRRADQTYAFGWKTHRAWRGTCARLELKFVDGQPLRSALFRME